MKTPPNTDAIIRTSRMIWFAFLSTAGIFAFVLKQMLSQAPAPDAGNPEITKLYAAVAGFMGLGSVVFRKAFDTGGDMQKWYVRNVICWVLNETIAIFGFIAANQALDFNTAVPFFVGSVMLTLLMYPTVPERGAI